MIDRASIYLPADPTQRAAQLNSLLIAKDQGEESTFLYALLTSQAEAGLTTF